MTPIKLIVAVTGGLLMAPLVTETGRLAVGAQSAQVGQGKAPGAVGRAPAAERAKADGDDHAAKPGADKNDDKPLLKFLKIQDRARSVVYAIDRSGSMATRGSLEVAKSELLMSLNQLSPDARFAVIFYNLKAHILIDDSRDW
jgi:Mg-chelatase subunit ChlD